MSSARRLYRLHLTVALLGGVSVALALAAAFTRLQLSVPSAQSVAAACSGVVPAHSLAVLLVVALIAVGLLVLAMAVRSALRQVREQSEVLRALERLRSISAASHPVTVFRHARPQAFCAGLLRPRIYVSSAAIEMLSPAELGAVIGHEAHHRARHDPLRLLLARVLADALFFLPGLGRLGERYRELAELAADEAATRAGGSKALAGALLTFGSDRSDAAGAVVGIAPERVDHLLGQAPRWQLPPSVFAVFALSLGGLLAAVATLPSLAGRGSLGVATLMAEACMAAMVALPVVAGLVGFSLSRRWLRRAGA